MRKVHEQRPRRAGRATESGSADEGGPAAAFWRLLFETSRDAVLAVDGQGRIQSCNPATLQLFARGEHELVGARLTDFLPEFALATDAAAARPASGTSISRAWRGDGTEYPVEILTVAARTNQQALDLVVIRDISHLESTTRIANEVAARFTAFMDHAPAIAFIKDRRGRYLYVNRRYEAHFGTRLDALRGQTDFDLRPEAIAEQLQIHDQTVLNQQQAQEFHEVVPDADGMPCNWLVLKFPLAGVDGEPLLGGMAIDITEQRRAERRLAMQYAVTQAMAGAHSVNEALTGLLPRLAEGTGWAAGEVWMVDPAGTVLRRAHAWHDPRLDLEEFERTSRETVFSRGSGIPGKVWERGVSIFCAELRHEPEFRRRVVADRTGLRVLHAFPIAHGGEVLGVVVFFSRFAVMPDRDLHLLLEAIGNQIGEFIRSRRNAERIRELELEGLERQHQAAIGAVTAQIVHDLGNPLSGLSLMAHTLLRDIKRTGDEGAASLRPLAQRIVDAVAHMDRVLLDLSHFVRGRGLMLRPVDIADLLRRVCDLWAFRATASGLTLRLDLPPAALTIRADADQLQRVFDNLVKNAIEASDVPGSTIRIGAELQGDKVRVMVADAGRGIPGGVNIFGLFETTKPGGTGLGLPICRQIIAKHGGAIDFAPVAPRGTVFQVELPIHGPPRIA
ncbi:MAG: PAS domain-containing protein [Gammaproteobacteria bacterium]|nr:PAS domain-containing protein [Gammaproteobacteria bacterium]